MNFAFMQGGRGAEWTGIPGGKFSLGRLEGGSGYCVGAVVETRMGIKEERDEVVHDGKRGRSTGRGGLGGNGMRDVWVIGEGFFRGVGGVFDVSQSRILRKLTGLFTDQWCSSRSIKSGFEYTSHVAIDGRWW